MDTMQRMYNVYEYEYRIDQLNICIAILIVMLTFHVIEQFHNALHSFGPDAGALRLNTIHYGEVTKWKRYATSGKIET